MSNYTEKESMDLLCEAMLAMNTVDECCTFLEDLCTVSERKAMAQRVEVAMRLDEGMIYRDILEETGASSATISRVNRCLHHGAGGYQAVLNRLKDKQK